MLLKIKGVKSLFARYLIIILDINLIVGIDNGYEALYISVEFRKLSIDLQPFECLTFLLSKRDISNVFQRLFRCTEWR